MAKKRNRLSEVFSVTVPKATVPPGCARSINVTYCLVMESAEEFGEVYASLQLRKDRHPVGSGVRERLLCLLDKMDVEFGKYQQEDCE